MRQTHPVRGHDSAASEYFQNAKRRLCWMANAGRDGETSMRSNTATIFTSEYSASAFRSDWLARSMMGRLAFATEPLNGKKTHAEPLKIKNLRLFRSSISDSERELPNRQNNSNWNGA